MDGKLNILLVVGKSQSFQDFDLFESLASVHVIRAATFLHDLRKPTYLSQLALQTFVEDQNLPGFMLGLEDELARADLVIASGFSDQATHQALRYCHQHNKTFLLSSSDPADLRLALRQNLTVIEDILRIAKGFFVYNEEAKDALVFLGVEESRILSLLPKINTARLGFSQLARDKFREYLKIDGRDLIILCSDPLNENCRVQTILFAVKELNDRAPEFAKKLRLIFTGVGVFKEKIKYLAVDLGLAKQLFFIAQDMSSFYKDLLSASEFAISWLHHSDIGSAHAAVWILEAMACGARPFVSPQHPLAEALSPNFLVERDDFMMLAQSIQIAIEQKDNPNFERLALVNRCQKEFDSSINGPTLLDFISKLDAQCPGGLASLHQDFTLLLDLLKRQKGRVPSEELLPSINQGLQHWSWHPEYRSQLQLFKGHLLLNESDLEGAMACFELCTSDECMQREAYLGLGKIAYMTFANEEALSFYRKALAIRPNDPETMAGLGHVYRKSALPDEAVYWLGRSLTVDIENVSTLFALTQACLECVDQEQAIEVLEQLKIMLGDKASIVMALGQLYYKVGNCEKGKILVDQALLISDQKPVVQYLKIAAV